MAIGVHAKGAGSRVIRSSVVGDVTEQKKGKLTLGVYKP